jgi:hypothetical protein
VTHPGSQFVREVSGALKATINAHGPIDVDNIPSATKRVTHALREAMKRERDRMMRTQPRKDPVVVEAIALLEDLVSGDEYANCITGDPHVDDTEHICFYCGGEFHWPDRFDHKSDCAYLKIVEFLKARGRHEGTGQ